MVARARKTQATGRLCRRWNEATLEPCVKGWRAATFFSSSPGGRRLARDQDHALEEIRSEVLQAPPPADASGPEAAPDELLGPVSLYRSQRPTSAACLQRAAAARLQVVERG